MKGRRKKLSLSKEQHIACTPSPQFLNVGEGHERCENIDANVTANDSMHRKTAPHAPRDLPPTTTLHVSKEAEDSVCIICGKDMSTWCLSEQERHVNDCVDERAGEETSKFQCMTWCTGTSAEVRCMICNANLSLVEEDERTKHVNDCCDVMIQV